MSSSMSKLFSKIISLIIIAVCLMSFRETILTDRYTEAAFGEILGILPFAKTVGEVICQIMKYKYEIPLITKSSVFDDLIKIAFMAVLQPIVGRLFSRIFLRIPSRIKGSYELEEYMDSFGYRIKEITITVLTAPILAVFASWISTMLFNYFLNTFGDSVSTLLSILSVILLGGISMIPLLFSGFSFGVVLLWRIFITFGFKIGTTFITNTICIWIFLAIINGVGNGIASSIITLIIWLFIMDFLLQIIKRLIVSV